MDMKSEVIRFVREECNGDTKEAAKRMGCSVSYILDVAPELKTKAQYDFDERLRRLGAMRG